MTDHKPRNRCHPSYLSPQAHVKLSTPGAFDGLRIHTDEINEVINRITPGTLTIAVVSRTLLSDNFLHSPNTHGI